MDSQNRQSESPRADTPLATRCVLHRTSPIGARFSLRNEG
jgi:hypothetical protein